MLLFLCGHYIYIIHKIHSHAILSVFLHVVILFWFYYKLSVPVFSTCRCILKLCASHAYSYIYKPLCVHKTNKLSTRLHTNTCFAIHRPVFLSVSRAESERNPWVVLTSALLTCCQGSEVKPDLGQQVVTIVRSLYNTKHKLPVQVNSKPYLYL